MNSDLRFLGLLLYLALPWGALLPEPVFAQGLQFSFEPAQMHGTAPASPVLWIKGDIDEGDATRLIDFLRTHQDAFIRNGGTATLAIDGGDVIEAWKIGETIRDALIELRLFDSGVTRCASACFFVYVSAVSRSAVEGTVGIHRPHIPAAKLARATPEQVRSRYATLIADTSKKLDELLVPRDVIEQMMRTPPEDTYSLSRDELDRVGEITPWFDDYSAARCGVAAGLRTHLRKAQAAGYELEVESLREQLLDAEKCFDGLRRERRQDMVDQWRAPSGR
jgi:hypothetical protein